MPGSGASILRRLFHWPVTIAFQQPEPISTSRWRCVLKMQESVLLKYHLHVRSGYCMALRPWVLRLFKNYFQAESDLECGLDA